MVQAETALDRDPSSTFAPSLKRNEIIRGTNDRLRSEGKVPVVFFDIRTARTAQDVLSTRYSNNLQRYTSGRVNENGDPLAVSARLAPMEDVVAVSHLVLFTCLVSPTYLWCQILGKSVFLDSIDGSFSIKVQRVNQPLATETSPIPQFDPRDDETDGTPEADHSSFVLSGINISVLQNILKSYGSIRILQYIGKEIEENGVRILCRFTAEYLKRYRLS